MNKCGIARNLSALALALLTSQSHASDIDYSHKFTERYPVSGRQYNMDEYELEEPVIAWNEDHSRKATVLRTRGDKYPYDEQKCVIAFQGEGLDEERYVSAGGFRTVELSWITHKLVLLNINIGHIASVQAIYDVDRERWIYQEALQFNVMASRPERRANITGQHSTDQDDGKTASPPGPPLPVRAAADKRRESEPDALCDMLFAMYVAPEGKVNTSTRQSAERIVAERGREKGFWKAVLKELQSDDEGTEIGCVSVLGKMLALDAQARDTLRLLRETEQEVQQTPSVYLGPEVVEELVARGMKAGRDRLDHYAIASARARAPEAKEFFETILRDNTGMTYMSSTKFHAAVGLAQLGEPAGYEWLLARADTMPHVANALPGQTPGSKPVSYCVMALRHLSGNDDLSTAKEWRDWWESVDMTSLPEKHVPLVDP